MKTVLARLADDFVEVDGLDLVKTVLARLADGFVEVDDLERVKTVLVRLGDGFVEEVMLAGLVKEIHPLVASQQDQFGLIDVEVVLDG